MDVTNLKKKVTEITTSYNDEGQPYSSEMRESFYDHTGNEIVILEYTSNKEVKLRIESSYDQLGRIIFRKQFMFPGPFFTETTFKYCNLKTNEPSEMLEVNSHGKIVFLLRKEFDSNGKILKELWYDSDDTSKIESINRFYYDIKGFKAMERYYFEGILQNERVNKYNEAGHLIEVIETQASSKTLTKITYDDGLRIEDEFLIDRNNVKKLLAKRFYAAHKETLMREIQYWNDGINSTDITYKYNYSNDQKLTRLQRYENGKLEEVKEYIYEYY